MSSWRARDHDVPRERFNAKCSKCGIQTTVPFQPTPERPAMCRDCWTLYSPSGTGGMGGFGGGRR